MVCVAKDLTVPNLNKGVDSTVIMSSYDSGAVHEVLRVPGRSQTESQLEGSPEPHCLVSGTYPGRT